MTQSLLIYTEWQQRFCACVATHIHDTIFAYIYRMTATFLRMRCNSYTWHNLCLYIQNDSNVFAHALQLIYITYIYITKTWLSFYAFTRSSDAVNWSIFALLNWCTCIAITYTAKTWHNLCSYIQNNSNVFAHALQLIYITHIHIAKTRLSFCTFTHLCNAVNRSIFRFIRSMYMHRNHIHCKDMT